MTGDWSFWYRESCKREIVNMQLYQLPIFNKLKKYLKGKCIDLLSPFSLFLCKGQLRIKSL